jgi:5-formyltetrahydrofolate cyclo-ligase
VPQPNAEKAALRRAVLARRDALPADARAQLDRRITGQLLTQPALAQPRAVLAYLSFGSEFDTGVLLRTLMDRGVGIVLPRVNRHARCLELYLVQDLAAGTAAGTWGIREPVPERCAVAQREAIDAVLAPGVAFTRTGERLGYGGGFYDKLLGSWPQRPRVIAAAYGVQLVDRLPMAASDIPMDAVVTEDAAFTRAA